MRQLRSGILLAGIIFSIFSCRDSRVSDNSAFNPVIEREIVNKVIHNAICWAMTKDTTTLFSTFVPDSSLFIFSPDSASTLSGFRSILELAEDVWMTDHFRALECNVRDMRIQFSRSGETAWYSCYLDDISEWDGRRSGWLNVRWTGVLEKRDGRWLIMQMHFSYPEERFR